MGFESFIGNENLIKLFTAKIKSRTLSHAYLLTGPDGSGKKTFAMLIAQAICCKSDFPPCGECSACKRVADGSHPDVHLLENDGSSAVIKVDAVRKFIAGIELTPSEADKKIYIIDNAETLGKESQNVLLKTLEEPMGNALFLLLASSEAALLPTVRSRCTDFTMESLGENELTEYLVQKLGADTAAARSAARLSGGYIGTAQNILSEKGGFVYRDTARNVLTSLASGDKVTALSILFVKPMCARDKLAAVYGYMQLALRDIATRDYGEKHPDFFANAEEAESIRRKFTVSRAIALYELLENEKSALSAYANAQLSALRVIQSV